MPTDIWTELGKLCYYVFDGTYPCAPDSVTFMATKGFGPAVQALFGNPEQMKNGLIANWDGYCKEKISTTVEIPLSDELKDFIEKFDFSIIDGMEPTKFLEQYAQVPGATYFFGKPLKTRDYNVVVPEEVNEALEARYVKQLCNVYSDCSDTQFNHHAELKNNPAFHKHFNRCRISFYTADTLKIFARDSYPEHTPFQELKEQILDGVQTVLDQNHQTSFDRLNAVLAHSTQIQLDANVLTTHLLPRDRIGICHHLANEDHIIWVEESNNDTA